jgi:hypothetical protein
MKNLLEKLKPEVKAIFEKDKEKFPRLVQEIYQDLETNFYVSDVKYFTGIELKSSYYFAFKKYPQTIWDCFNN